MITKSLSTVLVASAFSAFAASAAYAACGSRPGTPNEVRAEPLAGAATPTIRFSWRNTTGKGMNRSGSTSQGDTPHSMWFDISVRDGRGNMVGKDMGGHGPFSVTYGSRSHQDFTGLSVPSTFCFRIRARTAGGTQGCVSQQFSNQVCATTTASTPPKPGTVVIPGHGSARKLGISVVREASNVFLIKAWSLKPGGAVTIRVVDNPTLQGPFITSIGGRPILADAQGRLTVRLYGLCGQAKGPLSFSANGGTGWTNAVTVACQR